MVSRQSGAEDSAPILCLNFSKSKASMTEQPYGTYYGAYLGTLRSAHLFTFLTVFLQSFPELQDDEGEGTTCWLQG